MRWRPNIYTMLIGDVLFLSLAFAGADRLVMQTAGWRHAPDWGAMAALVGIQLLMLYLFRLYRTSLRHASIDSLLVVCKAITTATILFVLGLYLVQHRIGVEMLVVDWLLAMAVIGGSRFMVRFYFEWRRNFHQGRRMLIYGAGDMGSLAVRQLRMDREMAYTPIAFVDDDPSKLGRVIQGLKVLGSLSHLEEIMTTQHIEEIVVAIANLPGDKLRDLVKRCRKRNIICRIIPRFSLMLEIEPKMRNIELADLMRRAPRDLDTAEIQKYLFEKCVLITGAAGSIGSELVRQCLRFGPRCIIAFDQSEFGLYNVREELGDAKIIYVLGDACNRTTMQHVFATYHPEIVFHAAAYKHVPMLENNPLEGVRNNVGSTRVVAELSHQHHVKSFVLISTDKAVRPSSIMGASKRVCELFIQNFNRFSSTEFVAVRFGNVLGSSGSVIPKFLEQIQRGGPVTVTHPDATRYFMLITEAVQLVLQAAAIGKGGEVFILDMGAPVKIAEMAEDLIYLMGRRPHHDVAIQFTGLQRGEKVYEELFHEEIEDRTRFADILVGRSVLLEWGWFEAKINELLDSSRMDSIDRALSVMGELVSEGVFGEPAKILNTP